MTELLQYLPVLNLLIIPLTVVIIPLIKWAVAMERRISKIEILMNILANGHQKTLDKLP